MEWWGWLLLSLFVFTPVTTLFFAFWAILLMKLVEKINL